MTDAPTTFVFDPTQSSGRLCRILRAVAGGPASMTDIHQAIAQHRQPGRKRQRSERVREANAYMVGRMAEFGLIVRELEGWTLTAAGRDAHDQLLAHVGSRAAA